LYSFYRRYFAYERLNVANDLLGIHELWRGAKKFQGLRTWASRLMSGKHEGSD
jgi:hypothetical protein